MRKWQSYSLLLMSVAGLAGMVGLILLSRATQNVQLTLQSQQEEINRGAQSQQVGNNLLQDIGAAAAKNPRLKNLLAQNGFQLTPPPAVTPATGGKSP